MKLKYHGFTLAEILITLGVIGVVSAMTLPTVMKNYQDFQYKISAKKALRDVNNAYRMMMANDDEFAQITCPNTGYCSNSNFGNNFKLLAKQFKATKTCFSDNVRSCFECEKGQAQSPAGTAPNYYGCADSRNYSFIDSSGRAWAMYYNRENTFFVDTNGFKGPNHLGKDRWAFLLPTPRNQKTNKSFIIPQYDSDVKSKNYLCPSGDCKYYSVFYK